MATPKRRTAAEVAAQVAKAAKKTPATPKPRTEFVQLDAAAAQKLLDRNKFYQPGHEGRSNRRFRPDLAKSYAEAMLRGEWMFTNDGAAFDWNGDMLDGQHILSAVVLADVARPGIEVPVAITYDLDPDSMSKFDIGRRRQVADFLQIEGYSDAYSLAAVAKMVIFYNDPDTDPWTWRKGSVTPDQVLDVLMKEPGIPDAMRRSHLLKIQGDRRPLLIPGGGGAAIHVCQREYPGGPMEEFLTALATGEGLLFGDPRLALRNGLLSARRQSKRHRDAVEQMALFIKAWNGYVNGSQRVLSRWTRSEPFPRAVSKV